MARSLNVLLGISGGIAAYKSAEIVRRLRDRGHEVRCTLTRGGAAFITPLTLEVLSAHPVYDESYLSPGGDGEELHLTAARWADVLCVAPATANTLAKLARGLADDFLTTAAVAFPGPVVVAPAMHPAMWQHQAVAENVAILEARGVVRVGPVVGPLASGELGIGRLADPEEIAAAVEAVGLGPLRGLTVLVTAGPTAEAIDPVRFLSNRSSGKMGFALAAEAARRGARTVLIAGPVTLPTPPGVERIDVTTAREMKEAVLLHGQGADAVIMAAAVADFRPRRAAEEKVKKRGGAPTLELAENPDILSDLAALEPPALKVGFAAETGDLEAEAQRKLEAKGLDYLVANDVSRSDIGFGSDENEVTVFARDGKVVAFERQTKSRLAGRLLDLFTEGLAARERRLAGTVD